MKTIRMMMASAVVAVLTASCLGNDDPYNAGFFFYRPAYAVNTLYANCVSDSLSFFSYGNWAVTRSASSNANWLQLTTSSGRGSTYYTLPITFEQNTTGEGRGMQLTFTDTNHPDDAHAALLYWQYGTRGDGTLGSASDVKAIHCSDGTQMEFAYDAQHRPTSLRMTGEDSGFRSLSINYNDRDSIITVTDNTRVLTSAYGQDYQPQLLIGGGDTIGYYSQYFDNGFPISANNAFNLEHHTATGQNTYYAFLLNGQSLLPDSLHCADSLRIARSTAGGTDIQKYKLTYHDLDNRRQSVDVNQLILGTQLCDPYQLLSLFRYARQTSIVSRMDHGSASLLVEAELNADRSVSKLTIKRVDEQANGLEEQPLVFTFEY